MTSDYQLTDLLMQAQTIAVVGLSEQRDRPSYAVASFLKRNGYRVLPVNPHLTGPVLGMQPYASLHEIGEPIDLVVVFRRPEFVPEVVEDAIAVGARTLWLQLGVINHAAAARARQAGMQVVMDRCIAIEHRRLMRYAEAIW